jgi:hypothetical protein
MTNQQHPITPTPELAQEWWASTIPNQFTSVVYQLCTQAAQWGADQELEACVEWIAGRDWTWTSAQLRAARRPKPPSLKKQALALVEQHEEGWRPSPKDWDTIRQALEALPND